MLFHLSSIATLLSSTCASFPGRWRYTSPLKWILHFRAAPYTNQEMKNGLVPSYAIPIHGRRNRASTFAPFYICFTEANQGLPNFPWQRRESKRITDVVVVVELEKSKRVESSRCSERFAASCVSASLGSFLPPFDFVLIRFLLVPFVSVYFAPELAKCGSGVFGRAKIFRNDGTSDL